VVYSEKLINKLKYFNSVFPCFDLYLLNIVPFSFCPSKFYLKCKPCSPIYYKIFSTVYCTGNKWKFRKLLNIEQDHFYTETKTQELGLEILLSAPQHIMNVLYNFQIYWMTLQGMKNNTSYQGIKQS